MIKVKIEFEKGQNFKLLKEKVSVPGNSHSCTYVYSKVKTRHLYRDILVSNPHSKGAVVIYGLNGNGGKVIDCVFHDTDVREKFSKSIRTGSEGDKLDRFSWMESILSSRNFRELKICVTSSLLTG